MNPDSACTLDHADSAPTASAASALSLGEHLRRWARDYAHRTALVDRHERLTYSALDRRADRLAAALHREGLRPGDRALVQMPNGIGFATVLFALFRLGAVPVLAMPQQRAHDVHALCRLAEPSAYFIADAFGGFDYLPLAGDVAGAHPSIGLVVVDGSPGPSGGFRTLAALDADPIPLATPSPSDTALLLLSGGTTGAPKLIPRTHADYAYNFIASARLCGLGADSVYMAVLPVAHNFALACPGMLGALASGGKVLLSDTAGCDEAMPMIAREGVTHMAMVPTLAQLWVEARAWEDSDLSSLRLLQVGGARLDAALARRMIDVLGAPLQQVFGMAEGLVCYTRLDDPIDTILNTQGRPLSPRDEIRVVDEDGGEAAPGGIGELLTRGPYTIGGYYRAPEQNALSFTADGYYRTGDLVRQDAAGNLIVEGRIKEQINRAGEKISAAEVEGPLKLCPGVEDAVVVPVPDPLLGERICAFLRVGRRAPDKAAIRRDLQARGLSGFKLPDQIETVALWPVTSVGKIDKQKLIAMAQDAAAVRGRYAEAWVQVASHPLDLAARLVRALPDDDCTLYERGGEWSLGVGAAMSAAVEPDGAVVRSDGARWTGMKVCAALAQAMSGLPFDGWRAYGRARFEFCRLLYGGAPDAEDAPLLQLSIPRSEIRLTEGRALIRSLEPSALDGLAGLVAAQDAAAVSVAGDLLPLTLGAGGEPVYKAQVASAVREMQARRYQKVILSRAVEVPAALDLPASYLVGRRANTPARSFFVKDGEFTAFGFSPETVVEVDADGMVSTQPLAGTRALTGDADEDARLRSELMEDAKEIAEHAVSVKLAMDELAPVCSPGSLGVSEFMRVSPRGAVQHLASRVSGRLAEGRNAWDAFEALFPAVTASGIPKREALDSIRRHEPSPRGLYSGCVMIVEDSGAMDAALVLRSVFRQGDRCWLQAGAGLVPLSTPEREWTETCEKLRSVACHLRQSPKVEP